MSQSATAEVLAKLPKLLQEPPLNNGASLEDIWQVLEKDSSLSKVLVNEKGEKRLGILLGISTRIKAGRLPGLAIVKQNGQAKWYSSDSELDLWIRQMELLISQAGQLSFPSKWEDKKQEKIANNLVDTLKKTQEQVVILKSAVNQIPATVQKETDVKQKVDKKDTVVKKPVVSAKNTEEK